MNEEDLQPTEKEYYLKCKIKVVEQSHVDEADGDVLHSSTSVVLIPEHDTDQGSAFLSAWLPNVVEEYNEIEMELNHPLFCMCKGAVCRDNDLCSDYHIYVMSSGVIEKLRSKNGQKIYLKVLSEHDEGRADTAPSINRTARKDS